MRSIRVSQVDYHPREFEYNKGDHSPLQVIIRGTDREGQFQQAILMDTLAHFWVPVDVTGNYFWRLLRELFSALVFEENIPYPGNDLPRITDKLFDLQKEFRKQGKYEKVVECSRLIKLANSLSKIVKVEAGWKSVTDGTPCWMVEVTYPWVVRDLRDFFEIHYQADVVYSEAVRVHYKIPEVITIPEKPIILPGDISPYNGKSVFPIRDWIVDIETGETEDGKFPDPETNPTAPITAMTFMDNRNGKIGGKILAGTIAKVDPAEVKRMLSDPNWLRENQWEPSEKDIYPINPNTIEIYCFNTGNPMVDEKNLLLWEAQMLERMKPTHLMAWNSDFDSNYRRERSKMGRGANRLPYMDWNNICQVFDAMHGYENAQENMPPSLSLEYVSGFELGYGKLGKKSVADLMKTDPNKFLAYNIWDCVLVNRIDAKIRILSAAQSLADFHKTDISNYGSAMKLIESNLAYIFRDTKEVMPSISCVQKLVGTATIDQGGFVHAPPTILCKNLIVLDNKKEYVNVMISANTDHKTLVPKGVVLPEGTRYSQLPSGNRYLLDVKGPVPEILKEMVIKREAAQKVWEDIKEQLKKYVIGTPEFVVLDDKERVAYNAQFNLKTSSNMYFGVYGTAYSKRPFRLAHPQIGSDITQVAQDHLRWNWKTIAEHKIIKEGVELTFEVISGDTDASDVVVHGFEKLKNTPIAEIAKELSKYLNSTFDEFALKEMGIKQHTLGVKVDEIFKVFLQWGKKKRYAFMLMSGKIDYRGVEMRRSSSTTMTKDAQEEVFKEILTSGEFRLKELSAILGKVHETLKGGLYNRACGQSVNVNSEKETTCGHKAITYSNSYLGKNFSVGGGKVALYKVLSVRGKPIPEGKNPVVALEWSDTPDEFGLVLDYESALDSFVIKPIMKILGEFGFTWTQLLNGLKLKKIGDDF